MTEPTLKAQLMKMVVGWIGWCPQLDCGKQAIYCLHTEQRVDEILKVMQRPEPSREALVRLMNNLNVPTVEFYINHFMAWARGQEEKPTLEPVWCKHLKWKTAGDKGYWLYEDTTFNPSGIRHQLRPMDQWDQCPVAGCHAPRPGG